MSLWSADRRLEFIEFRLYWEGRINRRDLIAYFGISVPQAALDFRRYQDLAPGNLVYDATAKAYIAAEGFRPILWRPDSQGFFDQLLLAERGDAAERSWLGRPPEFAVSPRLRRVVAEPLLRALLKAIRERNAIDALYQSRALPDPSWRRIAPLFLGSDGFRWHVRAYCFGHERHLNFNLARILDLGTTAPHDLDPAADKLWHEIVTVRLAARRELCGGMRRVIELDYGMVGGELAVPVRAALLAYFLTDLRVDFETQGKPAYVQPLWVINDDEVRDALTRSGFFDRPRLD